MVAHCALNHRFMSIKKTGTVMWSTKNPSGEDYSGDKRGLLTSQAAVIYPSYCRHELSIGPLEGMSSTKMPH